MFRILKRFGWRWQDNPKATDLAEIVKGLVYHGKDLPPGVRTYSEERFPGAYQGYVRLERGLQIHQLPELYWMNLAKEAILRSGLVRQSVFRRS